MTVNGFAMRIITQCTAIHYVIILSTAILLYTIHSIAYRVTGVVVSTLIVIIANAIRLIITGVTGSISWDAFVIVHDYLWLAGFSLLVLGIWILWAERKFSLTLKNLRRFGIVLTVCTAVYGAIYLAMPLFGGLIAGLASTLFRMLISNPKAGILFNDHRMVYSYTGGTFSANFVTDLMAVALYIGLLVSRWDMRNGVVKRGLVGLAVILCVIATVIAGAGAITVATEKSAAVLFLWTGHGILLSLSICLWWVAQNGWRNTFQKLPEILINQPPNQHQNHCYEYRPDKGCAPLDNQL